MCSCQCNYTFDVLLDIFTTDFRLKIDYEKMEIIRKVDGETKSEIIKADTSPKVDADVHQGGEDAAISPRSAATTPTA